MREKQFCKGCGKAINTMIFIGEPFQEFEDGIYCQKCAKIRVKRARRSI